MATETPSFELQMIDYLRARYRNEVYKDFNSAAAMPSWCPSAIRIESPVHGLWPDNESSVVLAGDHPCQATVFGVINCSASDGNRITVRLLDVEILAFRWNAKREAVLCEVADRSA
jgi:hypothetical protein